MRIIGLDIGSVRIGVATSDLMQIIASPCMVYKRTKSINNDAKFIAELAKEKEAESFVVGLPLKLDGSAGSSVDMVNEFIEKLKKYSDLPIIMQDERLSTTSAERILLEGNVRRDKRKDVIDKVAATIILQNYLDKNGNKKLF